MAPAWVEWVEWAWICNARRVAVDATFRADANGPHRGPFALLSFDQYLIVQPYALEAAVVMGLPASASVRAAKT